MCCEAWGSEPYGTETQTINAQNLLYSQKWDLLAGQTIILSQMTVPLKLTFLCESNSWLNSDVMKEISIWNQARIHIIITLQTMEAPWGEGFCLVYSLVYPVPGTVNIQLIFTEWTPVLCRHSSVSLFISLPHSSQKPLCIFPNFFKFLIVKHFLLVNDLSSNSPLKCEFSKGRSLNFLPQNLYWFVSILRHTNCPIDYSVFTHTHVPTLIKLMNSWFVPKCSEKSTISQFSTIQIQAL